MILIVGNRMVDVAKLVTEMKCWSYGCETDLHLRDIVEEKVFGLASLWTFRCSKCGILRDVSTSKTYMEGRRYEINARFV